MSKTIVVRQYAYAISVAKEHPQQQDEQRREVHGRVVEVDHLNQPRMPGDQILRSNLAR